MADTVSKSCNSCWQHKIRKEKSSNKSFSWLTVSSDCICYQEFVHTSSCPYSKYHCGRRAVIDAQFLCRYHEMFLMSSLLVLKDYRSVEAIMLLSAMMGVSFPKDVLGPLLKTWGYAAAVQRPNRYNTMAEFIRWHGRVEGPVSNTWTISNTLYFLGRRVSWTKTVLANGYLHNLSFAWS